MRMSIIIIYLLLAASASADTLLAGYDPDAMSSSCFVNTEGNLDGYSWKAFRVTATTSGTISYFRMKTVQTDNCPDDEVGWGIYDDNSGAVGTLKAYGYYPHYNWTAIGQGIHKFAITTVVTNANVVAGTNYWLVIKSRDMSPTYTTCNTGEISLQRGTVNCARTELVMLGSPASGRNAWTVYTSPPPPERIAGSVASYFAWSVWASEDSIPPAPPLNLRAE